MKEKPHHGCGAHTWSIAKARQLSKRPEPPRCERIYAPQRHAERASEQCLKVALMTKGDLWANETSVLASLPDLGQDGVNSQGKRTLFGEGVMAQNPILVVLT